MRVVFLEDVPGVAHGGEVKEVKNGFARNYLIPQNLAAPATHNTLQGVERLKREAGVVRVRELADMKALAEELDGKQVEIEMRAGPGGRLYGSVTNIMIAEELSRLIGRELDRRTVRVPEAIRDVGTFDLKVELHPEVEAEVRVLVYATGTDPMALIEAADEAAAAEAETEPALMEGPDAGAVEPEAESAEQAATSGDDEESE